MNNDSPNNQMLHTARELFFRCGFKSVTMDDVASQLGMSKKTVYREFPNKETLIKNCCELFFTEQHATIKAIEAARHNAIVELQHIFEHNCTFLRQVHPSVLYDLQKYHPAAWQIFIEFKEKYIMQSVLKNLQKGVGEELYRTDMNQSIIARIYISRIDMLLDDSIFPREEFTLSRILKELFIYHVRGIATEKGLAQLNKIKLSF